MIDIKEFFAQFSNANYFSRVDNVHPLELHIGLDEKGRKAIELRSAFTPRKVTGTSAIEDAVFAVCSDASSRGHLILPNYKNQGAWL